jgi:membrane fusion protein (multidrug efflux system)
VQPGTGSFLLRVLVPNPNNLLLPGTYVRATISEGVLKNALLAPQRGITRDPRGNATAMVVGKDGKVELRNVTTARSVGDQWLVTAGLAAGDRVIVEGLQKIGPGMPVQATESDGK